MSTKWPNISIYFLLEQNVQKHNDKMLSLGNWETITLKAYDKKIDSIETSNYESKKMHFPSVIVLKEHTIVELIWGNYAIEDGIMNGVEGIFRSYTLRHKWYYMDWICKPNNWLDAKGNNV